MRCLQALNPSIKFAWSKTSRASPLTHWFMNPHRISPSLMTFSSVIQRFWTL